MRFFLFLVLLLNSNMVFAQDRCEWKIQDVVQDEVHGSILVKTNYSIDGYSVYDGETRYDNKSGSALHVTRMIHNDVKQECAYLLKTKLIPDRFYDKPEVKAKKQNTKELLVKLKKLKNLKGKVTK